MKRLILFIVTICLAETGFSQTDFRKGYVITNAGDTIAGLVDYREGTKAYKSCDFKKSVEQNTVTYGPEDIAGYGFENDKAFQSRTISLRDQSQKTAFIEVIVSGIASLYKFESKYFIDKNKNEIKELFNEQKEVTIDGKRGFKNSNQHISTLNILLSDCNEVMGQIQRVTLDQKSLTNLVVNYNRCKGEPGITFKASKPWTKVLAGITGGVNISQLNFNSNTSYKHLSGTFEGSTSPAIGISLDVSSPRLSERISFHTDALYLSSTYYKYSAFITAASSDRNYVTIELQQLKIPVGLRYTFPNRNFTPYATVGLSSTINLSSSSKWIQEREAVGIVVATNKEALTIKNNQVGFWGGCGVFKSVSSKLNAFAELRYEQTNGISQDEPNSKVVNFQILIGIRTK